MGIKLILSAVLVCGTLFSLASAEPVEDKFALLDFIRYVNHSQSLNWDERTSVCHSWTGVTCNHDSSRVIAVRLPAVGLKGGVPTNTLGRLSALQILSLRSNGMSGPFPSDILKLWNLSSLYLEFNHFEGPLPLDLSVWENLSVLNLSNNRFNGRIPSSISNLTHLVALDLANNSLSGDVPDLDIETLQVLDLSNNNLTGDVSRYLGRFPSSAFLGNNLTFQPSSATSPEATRKKHSPKFSHHTILAIVIGSSVAAFVAIALLLFVTSRRKKGGESGPLQKAEKSTRRMGSQHVQEGDAGMIFFEGCNLAFDLEDLLRASAEVLGKGTFGATYKAALEDATTVAVKRLKEVIVGRKDFEQQMEVVGNIRHTNVAPLRAYYYSKDEKLMVYDFYSQGSVSMLLHVLVVNCVLLVHKLYLDHEKSEKRRKPVSSRLGNAVKDRHWRSARPCTHPHTMWGEARARQHKIFEYFPQHPTVRLRERSRASNADEPRLAARSPLWVSCPGGDGLEESAAGVRCVQLRGFPAGASHGEVPCPRLGGEEVIHLVRWVNSVVREEWTGEVFDLELLRYPHVEEEMVSMLQIGLSCVARMPEQRPKMEQVVKMVEEIRIVVPAPAPATATRNSSRGGTSLSYRFIGISFLDPNIACDLGSSYWIVNCIVEMGKKKSDEAGAGTKSKQGGKEKFSVTELLASMDAKPEKPKKTSASTSKPKPKPAPKASSYIDGIDLPSSDEEEEELGSEEEAHLIEVNSRRNIAKPIDTGLTDKELKKRGKKDVLVAQAAEVAKKEALRDDRDAFTVVIGSRASVLDGENDADANVKDITVENFSVAARGKELLKNTSVKISHGKRYGLVGPNGMGKSTLLKLLAWRKIPVPKNIDVLLVEQEVVGDDRTALEAVVSANEELVKLREEVATLQDASTMSTGDSEEDDDEGNDVGEKLSELYEKLQLMGSDAAEAQASKILAGLGFTKDMQGRATRSFSGGWRMRISLARALFVQPTLLLLDEPTNHLDLRAVLWLEEYLCRWKKTLIVVSHDRDFLNTVCNEIIHLHDLKLHLYRGNFDDFEGGYEQRRKEANKKSEAYEKQLRNAKRSGSRTQQEKVKDRAKFNAAKEASKSKSKGKVDEDEPVAEAPRKWKDYTVEFHFPEPTELTPPLLQLLEVSFSYPNREDFRLSNVDVGIDMGTRVAIVGPNGAGKSTLLNLLAGDIVPTEGEVRRSQKLRIGRYSQHFVDLLIMDETPVQYLLRLHPEQEGLSKQEAVRAKLGKFGLPSHNHLTPIAKLSGGQKARVVFTSISMSKPHILLLDEPTNHLDMQSIDALADALDEFTGGVVLVSHDSRLISRVCQDEERSQIWVVENGTVEAFPDSFEDYKDELVKEIRAEVDD
ncbi:hypothetical protein SASPL_151176 [Salvia splendens]|uniref:ATP-binding cassette, subfamily F, member 1 n=2 Tax=Salvia splendens TaxID=180675 RepID=A0A8X8W865_SALSN|nr:hypothetical protein SASPL_151176 [Salvia splendens]